MNKPPETPTDPRIYMAAERTFLAWIRTGIACMGVGFVVARFGLFLRELANSNNGAVSPPSNGFSLPVGIALIGAGIIVILSSAIRHRQYVRRLDRGQLPSAHGVVFTLWVAGFLAAIGLAVAVYLVFVFR